MSEIITEALKKVREGKERKFKQTIDLVINLKNINLKKPENRIKIEVGLPHGTGKPVVFGLILDELSSKAKGLENTVLIKRDEIESLGKNKKQFKKVVSKCKFFIAEAPLMPLVGKSLGQVLAPRGLMPKPIPATADIQKAMDRFSKNVRIHTKNSPVVSVPVGTEEMDDSKLIENIKAVISSVTSALPKGKQQIKNGLLKTTMGKPIKFVIK